MPRPAGETCACATSESTPRARVQGVPRLDRAARPFPLDVALLVLQAVFVAVIGGDVGADGLAIVQGDVRARGVELQRVGVLHGQGVGTARLAEERADEVNIVDAVI